MNSVYHILLHLNSITWIPNTLFYFYFLSSQALIQKLCTRNLIQEKVKNQFSQAVLTSSQHYDAEICLYTTVEYYTVAHLTTVERNVFSCTLHSGTPKGLTVTVTSGTLLLSDRNMLENTPWKIFCNCIGGIDDFNYLIWFGEI